MRVLPTIVPLLALAIVGCARETVTVPAAQMRSIPRPPVSALAFTPPSTVGVADDLYLDRDGRGVYATFGYESQVISETYVRQDDRWRMDNFGDDGTFERRAISTTLTIRQR